MAPQNGFPNGPTSRVAVESEPTRDEAPSLPASAHRAPWMFGPSPLFDLVAFSTPPSRVYTPHGRAERRASRYTPAKRPRSLKPAAGHPENRTKGRRVRPLELSCDRTDNRSKGRWGSAHPTSETVSGPGAKKPLSLAFTVTDKQSKGRWGSAHPTSETCFWAWRRRKAPELSCDRYREPDQGALG
ncbi:hypothetical protein G5714_024725 [Onychostoma macrolepis]|uniref:Uncharacterized protein n=1 Tax=Onychostoma macrolepis TaxID=369639 RepID=A0A7J6BJV2_9TELE|nr:hypothetical protein G5714_024725 [Onychostoma macrolepis]